MSGFGCVVMAKPMGFNGALDLRSERESRMTPQILACRSGRIEFLLVGEDLRN